MIPPSLPTAQPTAAHPDVGDEALAQALAAHAAVDRDPASGLPLAEQAVRRAVRADHPAAASTAERAWGHALLHVGDLGEAARHLNRAMVWGDRAGSPGLTAQARYKLAFAVLQQGRPQAALRHIDAALPDLVGIEAARARAQRGIVLHVIGRLDDALAEFDVALRALHRQRDFLGVQRMLVNRALVHADRHSFTAAERDLVEAEAHARELGRPLTIGLIANNLGLMETLRGDVPAALRHLDRAERIICVHGAQLGTLHQDRAQLLLSVGLVAEAESAAAQAIQAYRRENRTLKVPEVQLLSAQAHLLAGDSTAAMHQARTAMRRFRAQGRPEWTELARLSLLRAQQTGEVRPRIPMSALATMVATLDAAGWPGAALDALIVTARLSAERARPHHDLSRTYLNRAAAAARTRGPALVRARGWYARALQRHAVGDSRGVLSAARTGLRILDEHCASLGATDLRVHATAHRADLVNLGLAVAFGTHRTDTLFEWSERARASQLLTAPVRPPEDPELTSLLAQLRSATRNAAEQTVAPTSLPTRQAALERRIRDRSRHIGSVGSAPITPVKPQELGAALGHWALVEYIRQDGILHALTVVDGRVRAHRLGTTAEAADLTERLTFAVRRYARRPATAAVRQAAAALLRTAAQRLDTLLLGPLAELADRPLVVVPTGSLHSLPWSVLPACQGRPVTLSPSATLWHAAHQSAPTARGTAASQMTAVAGPRLSTAALEAEQVAAIHGGTALTGAAATVDAVRSVLMNSGLVHFAAHGRLASENTLFSHIALSDGPLMIHDVERLPRVPHTVVLAACDSGRPVVHTGDELMGLAVAFLARSTVQLIASVLPIPDATTAPLMVAFHQGLAAGRPPAAALADAQHALDPDDADAAAAAAGFVCIGAGTHPLSPPQG